MRSLKTLDHELTKHNLLFGRGKERRELVKHLNEGKRPVLLAGMGGMGKSALMLHALRELGGVPNPLAGPPDMPESGHSLYFEDLGSFVRFLGVRNKPVMALSGSVVVRWDEGGVRKEKSVRSAGRPPAVLPPRTISAHGTSSVLQNDRLIVQTHLEMAVEPRFDGDEVVKLVTFALTELSETVARSISSVRKTSPDDAEGRGGEGPEAHLARFLAEHIEGTFDELDRRFSVLLTLFEERMGALVEGINKQVYISASSYLAPDDERRRRMAVREFEEGITGFLENANIDRLIPGDSTFWRWYIGIDHLERPLFGWTLEMKRQAVRMLFERLGEKEGFRMVAAMESNPRSLFPHVDEGRAMAGFDHEGTIDLTMVGMPERAPFVDEASRFIVDQVEDVDNLPRLEVPRLIGELYDHCLGRVRLYFLVRNIKNLAALRERGMDSVIPDASFLDQQIIEALNHLGIMYEYDRSLENIPAVQPLLVVAKRDAPTMSSHRAVSRNVMEWLLDAFEGDRSVVIDNYLEAMELYGVLRYLDGRASFYDSYVEEEFEELAGHRAAFTLPLLRTFQSRPRLTKFLESLSLHDLLDLEDYITSFLSTTGSSFKPDNGLYDLLIAELDEGTEGTREKVALLMAWAVVSKVPFSPTLEKVQKERVVKILAEALERGRGGIAAPIFSRALNQLRESDARVCVCGETLADEHCVCPRCGEDHRPCCPRCGSRHAPMFAYCPGCGDKL